MANMAYCMFQNTVQDFAHCVGRAGDWGFDFDALSSEEQAALLRLVKVARELVEDASSEEWGS